MTYPEQTQDTVNQGQALPSPVLRIPYYPPYCTPWGRSSSDGLGWEGNRRESGTPVPYFCTTILGEDLSPPWLLGPGPRPKRMRKVSIDRGISEAFSLGSQQSIPTSIAHPASQVRLSSVLIHHLKQPSPKTAKMHLLPSLTLLATAFTALSSAAALPQSESDLVESRTYGGNDKCLCEEDANTLRDAYVRMISAWNPVDAKYLTDDFKDTSASINILIGKPLDGSVPTFANKQEFVAHMTVAVCFFASLSSSVSERVFTSIHLLFTSLFNSPSPLSLPTLNLPFSPFYLSPLLHPPISHLPLTTSN